MKVGRWADTSYRLVRFQHHLLDIAFDGSVYCPNIICVGSK
jgi:hypothetical protein